MKKILAILLMLCTPAAAQNYLRDDGTFHSVVEGTSADQVLINTNGLLAGITSVANSVLVTDASAVPFWSTTLPLSVNRERLAADRIYYVRTLGSDTNCSGLANVDDPGTGTVPRACAFATLPKAASTVIYGLDFNTYNVTVTFTGVFTAPFSCGATLVGGGTLTLNAGSSTSIATADVNAIDAFYGCHLIVAGNNSLTLSTTGTGTPSPLMAYAFGNIQFSGINFAASVGPHIQSGWRAAGSAPVTDVVGVGTITATGNYTVSGGTLSHWHVTGAGSTITLQSGITVTVTGTPNFSAYFLGGSVGGNFYAPSATITGSATGLRMYAHHMVSFITPAGTTPDTFFPGDVAARVIAGGMWGTNDDLASIFGIGQLQATSTVVTGGTLAADTSVATLTATQPSVPTTLQNAVLWTITGAGSAAIQNNAFQISLAAGYTGASPTVTQVLSNLSAGTGAYSIPASGSNGFGGNVGSRGSTTATTIGSNLGGLFAAGNGDRNVGAGGTAQVAKNSATNIGVLGSAINTGTSPVHIGGFFSLNQTTWPSVSAGLIADNGAQTDAIFLGRDNGTTVFSIADGGAVTVTSSSANLIAAGRQGSTNPQLQVDGSTASVATGLKIKGAAAAGGLALSVITSGTNEPLTIDSAGSGAITLGGTSTGDIRHARNTNVSITAPTVAADALLTVNANTAATVALTQTPNLHIVGADTANAGIATDAYGNAARYEIRQANGTQASKTASSTASSAFTFNVYGWDTSAYAVGAQFIASPAETWSGSAHGMRWRFFTTPIGSTTAAEVVRIQDSGGVTIGSNFATDPGAGNLLITGMYRSSVAPTAVSGAGPIAIGSASTINSRMKVNLNGTDYWIPASTTAF